MRQLHSMDQEKQVLVSQWQEKSSVAALDPSKGPAERLWESCADIYVGLLDSLKTIGASENLLKDIRKEFKTFLLWGDGLKNGEGGLDWILQQSKRLRHSTIRILISMGRKLRSQCSPHLL